VKEQVSRLEMNSLNEPSRRFAEGLLRRMPDLADHAGMENRGANGLYDLVLRIPAPPGDRGLDLLIRMDRGEEPFLQFGDWRTREQLWSSRNNELSPRDGMYSLIEAILDDAVLLCEEISGPHDGRMEVIDLRIPDTPFELITRSSVSGRVRLFSWSGHLDMKIHLGDQAERNASTN